MIENILYKKSYEKTDEKDRERLFASVNKKDLEYIKRYISEYYKNRKYEKLPEKDALMRPFVQGAINFSNDMSVDVEIVQR
ncbi:MAG: hypothetical protein IKU19_09660, partial [Clostridia bacterium]|nr:hypothetical protein [Clostridia bacterium]